MTDEFINPNYHVVLVHFPLGLLSVGVLLEVLAPLLWPRSTARAAARWMIGIGALSMLPTSAVGMYALSDVVEPTPQADAFLERHAWLAGGATILAVGAVVLWIAVSDTWRRRLHWPLTAVLALAVGLSVVGAWFSGEAVYRHGTGVERLGADAGRDPTSVPTPDQAVAVAADTRIPLSPKYYLPPLQAHLLLAGFSAAFGFAGLGLAVRRVHADPGDELREIGRRLRNARPTATGASDVRQGGGTDVGPAATAAPSTPPAARYFVLAALLAAAAGAAGWWYLADASDAWATATDQVGQKAGVVDKAHATMRGLVLTVFAREPKTRFDFVSPRRVLHVLTGGVIVACMLALAILARWGRRRGVAIGVVSLVLLAATAWQTWLGGLMLFEGVDGPVTRMTAPD